MSVPFFRPELSREEIAEVVATLESGWLTTGPKVARFERAFAEAVGSRHALALNSCTAALHLAAEALGLRENHGVLVPTMTFAASAEIVRYSGAIPILVDCDPVTKNMDLDDAQRKIDDLRAGRLPETIDPQLDVVGIIPVHVGGLMLDVGAVQAFAERHGLWVIEDAAHALPAAWRPDEAADWQRCGEDTAAVTCFSFYANKTITTGEGGMAVTSDLELEKRMRSMSLHGLSADAWGRYTSKGSWDYRIIAPGFKYNMTDIAAAIGIHQLARAEEMRQAREQVARELSEGLAAIEEITLPMVPANRVHSWHLFQIGLDTDRLGLDRDQFLTELRANHVGFSVHWRPLHLHPYYQEKFGWRSEHLPNASACWRQSVSLPIFPAMRAEEISAVVATVKKVCQSARSRSTVATT